MENLQKYIDRFLVYLVSISSRRKKRIMDLKIRKGNFITNDRTRLENLFYDHCARPVRKYIYGKLGRFGNATSIWEFGASTGFNLFLIEKNFKNFNELIGFDIDPIAVDLGNEIAQKNSSHVRLEKVNMINHLNSFDNDCVDIILSQGFLVTIQDDQIESVLDSFIRMARVGVMLVERNAFTPYDILTARDDINTFDFERYLKSNKKIANKYSIEKIPSMRLLNPSVDINSIIFIYLSDQYFEPRFSLLSKNDFVH